MVEVDLGQHTRRSVLMYLALLTRTLAHHLAELVLKSEEDNQGNGSKGESGKEPSDDGKDHRRLTGSIQPSHNIRRRQDDAAARHDDKRDLTAKIVARHNGMTKGSSPDVLEEEEKRDEEKCIGARGRVGCEGVNGDEDETANERLTHTPTRIVTIGRAEGLPCCTLNLVLASLKSQRHPSEDNRNEDQEKCDEGETYLPWLETNMLCAEPKSILSLYGGTLQERE
mmetsp:Transcript_71163/g.167744  ORF Transcript_71163/g.167744 Transcript_71163/m.167744 type:complete len:226 (-) Transcript_71163:651-1328(-)